MQSILDKKVWTIMDFLNKNKMDKAEMMNYTTKTKQVEHNYNLIKENPDITLEEFKKKAIIITEDF